MQGSTALLIQKFFFMFQLVQNFEGFDKKSCHKIQTIPGRKIKIKSNEPPARFLDKTRMQNNSFI
jgi:hypothetical protein